MRINGSGIRMIMSALLVVMVSVPAVSHADDFDIDTAHSTAIFRINHLGFSNFYGRFNDISGTFTMNEKNLSKSAVHVVIKTGSIDTNNKKRDGHLRSNDFFNSKAFPVITFDGKKFEQSTPGMVIVTGDLTMHGVTKSIKFQVAPVGKGKDPWGGYRAGFEGRLQLNRSDYGMKYMIGAIGDTVSIILGVEGVRKK